MTQQTANIARIGRLRALKKLSERPLSDRTVRITSYEALVKRTAPQETTLNRLLTHYDNVVSLHSARGRQSMVFGTR